MQQDKITFLLDKTPQNAFVLDINTRN